MDELIIKTKDDMEKIKLEKPKKIIFEGELAEKMIDALNKKKKVKKASKITAGIGAGLAVIGGIVLAIPSGGTSLAGGVAIASGVVATIGGTTITLSLAEVAIIAGVLTVALGVTGITVNNLLKHYDFKFSSDKFTVEGTRKD